jgi:hypothetical protein
MFSTPRKEVISLPFDLANDYMTRIWFFTGLFMLGIFVLLIPSFFSDSRVLDGYSVWAKPLKFSLSLATHFFTLAILSKLLERKYRLSLSIIVVGYSAVVAALFEQLYITLQAARGERSHYNNSTEYGYEMFQLMGVGAIILVLISLLLGIMIWRYGNKTAVGFRLGAIMGLILGSILTALFAGYMSSQSSALVGQTISVGDKMPLVGWSRNSGDMRIAHFLATHLMQILPLIGWLSDKYKLPATKIVLASTTILTLLGFGLFILALAGQPLFPL